MYSTRPITTLIATFCFLGLTLLGIAVIVILALIPLYLDERIIAGK